MGIPFFSLALHGLLQTYERRPTDESVVNLIRRFAD